MTTVQIVDNSLEDPKKVFVGNIAFNVTDEMLAAYFSVCGKVESAKVIRRGTRSLGYGFVSFSTMEEAVAARTKFNHQLFEDREINVELTKSKSQIPSNDRPRNNNGRFRSNLRGRGGLKSSQSTRKTSPKSTTSLFIANLPYEMNDEEFAELFGQFSIENAHIVTTRNGRSRGYGFVKLSNEAEQKRALSELKNSTINDHPISVRIAFEPQNPLDTSSLADVATEV